MTSSDLQRAIAAVEAGRNTEAQALLAGLVKIEPDNEQAWLWLAAALESPERQRYCLERALKLNPTNPITREALAALGVSPPPAPSPAPLPVEKRVEPSAPQPLSSKKAKAGLSLVTIGIGCCLVSFVAFSLLMALPLILASLQQQRAAFNRAEEAAFIMTVMDYLGEFPREKVVTPYINRKAMVVDLDTETLSPVFYLLSDRVRATDPDEAGTVVQVSCSELTFYLPKDDLMFPGCPQYRVTLVDRDIPAAIGERTFGVAPPENPMLDERQPVELEEIAAWLDGLPVVDPAEMDPAACAPPLLDRFRQIRYDSQHSLAQAAEAFYMQPIANRTGPGALGQPEWLVRPCRLGCELQLKFTVDGQPETRSPFVVSLPAQEIYAADASLEGRLELQAKSGLPLPFRQTFALPVPLP